MVSVGEDGVFFKVTVQVAADYMLEQFAGN